MALHAMLVGDLNDASGGTRFRFCSGDLDEIKSSPEIFLGLALLMMDQTTLAGVTIEQAMGELVHKQNHNFLLGQANTPP